MKRRTIACLIARTVSTRLPLKVLRDVIPGVSMLDFMIQRLKGVDLIDDIYICTSKDVRDDILEDIANRNKIKCYRGSENAVIERMIEVGESESADYVIRITGDNPFTSIEYINRQIQGAINNDLDYVRVTNVPIGATSEVMKLSALRDCYSRIEPEVSEYLMLFMFNPEIYRCGVIQPFNEDYSNLIITVDSQNDLQRTRDILNLYKYSPLDITLEDIIRIINKNNIIEGSVNSDSAIKLPYGKTMTFADFKQDMEYRTDKSLKIEI